MSEYDNMVCIPHRTSLVAAMQSAFGLPGVLPSVMPSMESMRPAYGPVQLQSYQGAAQQMPYAGRRSQGSYQVTSALEQSFVEPFEPFYNSTQEVEEIIRPSNEVQESLEGRTKEIPRTSYQSNIAEYDTLARGYDSKREQDGNAMSREELTKFFVNERNPALRKQADNIEKIMNERKVWYN